MAVDPYTRAAQAHAETKAELDKLQNRRKIAFVEPMVAKENAPKGEKNFIDIWNAMQMCLVENGLMEDKAE